MIKLENLKVPAHEAAPNLAAFAADALGISESRIEKVKVIRRSVDARRRSAHFVYSLAVSVRGEAALISRGTAVYSEPERYVFPYSAGGSEECPVIVGMGPAGLFAALELAEAGFKCVLLERGRDVSRRRADVERFWRTGELDETSNVQFGEGGAGTFSDGKLTTGVNDVRMRHIMETFVKYGAPEEILVSGKPHIGTDILATVVRNMRERLISLGCDVRFETTFIRPETEDGALCAVTVRGPEGEYGIQTKRLILAPGNAARDTFEELEKSGLVLEAKPFSVGVRIEHRQADVDAARYGEAATLGTLPPSDYKLAAHLENGRSVYTFCVCPGGYVVAAASEKGGVVTNGMSEYGRDGENCNGGLLVSVTPEDFGGSYKKAIEFQRELERAAYSAGGGSYSAPAQTVGDFLAHRKSVAPGKILPTYRPEVTWCDLWDVLPRFVCESIEKALPELDRKIRGFASPDAVLTAAETRSSCPVRIKRENGAAVGMTGVYPCGEGAGYAGGIMSAAADGIKAAERVCADILAAGKADK